MRASLNLNLTFKFKLKTINLQSDSLNSKFSLNSKLLKLKPQRNNLRSGLLNSNLLKLNSTQENVVGNFGLLDLISALIWIKVNNLQIFAKLIWIKVNTLQKI